CSNRVSCSNHAPTQIRTPWHFVDARAYAITAVSARDVARCRRTAAERMAKCFLLAPLVNGDRAANPLKKTELCAKILAPRVPSTGCAWRMARAANPPLRSVVCHASMSRRLTFSEVGLNRLQDKRGPCTNGLAKLFALFSRPTDKDLHGT